MFIFSLFSTPFPQSIIMLFPSHVCNGNSICMNGTEIKYSVVD